MPAQALYYTPIWELYGGQPGYRHVLHTYDCIYGMISYATMWWLMICGVVYAQVTSVHGYAQSRNDCHALSGIRWHSTTHT